MAKTINELIYNLRAEIKDNQSDDVKLTDRNLEFMINYIRVKLIRQDLQKGREASSNITQSLGVIELESVDTSEDSDFNTGNSVLRSIKDVPTPIDFNGDSMFTSIGGLDGNSTIDFVPVAQANKRKNLKYSSKRLTAYYDNDKLYIINCDAAELQYITASGVFENPREVANFKKKNGKPCYDPNKDSYPMSSHMIDMMNSIIKNQELDLYFQLIKDNINDGRSND